MPQISSVQAREMVRSAQDEARELGISISVAVMGGDGALVCFDRMDGARPVTAKLALGKARASALWGRPSSELATRFEPVPQLTAALIAQWHGEFVAVGGAIPITVDGMECGSIGVSGGTADQDVACAMAGTLALSQ